MNDNHPNWWKEEKEDIEPRSPPCCFCFVFSSFQMLCMDICLGWETLYPLILCYKCHHLPFNMAMMSTRVWLVKKPWNLLESCQLPYSKALVHLRPCLLLGDKGCSLCSSRQVSTAFSRHRLTCASQHSLPDGNQLKNPTT